MGMGEIINSLNKDDFLRNKNFFFFNFEIKLIINYDIFDNLTRNNDRIFKYANHI